MGNNIVRWKKNPMKYEVACSHKNEWDHEKSSLLYTSFSEKYILKFLFFYEKFSYLLEHAIINITETSNKKKL